MIAGPILKPNRYKVKVNRDLLKEQKLGGLSIKEEAVVEDDSCHTFDCTKRGDTKKNL